MSMPRLAQNPESPVTIPDWSRQTTSMEYGNSSVRGARGSVRFKCSDRPVASPRRVSSLSSLARECQLPLTNTSMANSFPRLAMRLSLMEPPQSAITRVRSWTIPVRSLPMADTARCCFIWRRVYRSLLACEWRVCARTMPAHLNDPRIQRMFAGSLVALVTPMQPDGSIDFDAWSRLIEFHVANGTTGIVVAGSTGESATVTDGELRELLLRARRSLGKRALLIANAGTSSTATSVERARWISELEVDALLIASPAYVRPTQQGLYLHFEAIAANSSIPVLLYNVPSRTAVDMLPATVARLSRLPRIAGIKEAVGEAARVRELVATCAENFKVLSGDDLTARDAIGVGAAGVISVTANVAPRAMADMVAAALLGDRAGATQIDQRLVALHRNLFVESNPIPVKWAVARMGLIGGTLRLPLTELSPEFHAVVAESLFAAGITVSEPA